VPDYDAATMATNAAGVYLAGVVCGGLNTREWYIENSRDHGDKIMADILSKKEKEADSYKIQNISNQIK